MKKRKELIFVFLLCLVFLFSTSGVFAAVCSDPSQVILNLNQSLDGLASLANVSYPYWGIYGDANLDGVVDYEDFEVISNLVWVGIEPPLWGRVMADVNLDGAVFLDDLILVYLYINNEGIDKLPVRIQRGSITPQIKWGDVDTDGDVDNDDISLLNNHLNNGAYVSPLGLLQANVNFNNVAVNNDDAALLVFAIATGIIDKLPQFNAVDFSDVVYGDVDGNGIVNYTDVLVIINFTRGIPFPVSYGQIIADAFTDGAVNISDAFIVAYYSNNKIDSIPYVANPSYVYVSDNPIYGDVNIDGRIDELDYQDLNDIYINYNNLPTDSSDPVYKNVLPLYGEQLADLNLDGRINFVDLNILQDYLEISDLFPNTYTSLPIYDDNLGSNGVEVQRWSNLGRYDLIAEKQGTKATQICYGDVFPGKYYPVENSLDEYDLYLADVNLDGFVNNLDYYYETEAINGKITLPVYKGIGNRNILWGDVNQDSQVNQEDVDLLSNHLDNSLVYVLPGFGNIMADVNIDNRIDQRDLELLEECLPEGIGTKEDCLPIFNGENVVPTWGDFNSDGMVRGSEASIIINQITSTNPQVCNGNNNLTGLTLESDALALGSISPSLADFDGDGIVEQQEVLKIINYVANPLAYPLNDWEKNLADLDQDGDVDSTDTGIANQLNLGVDITKIDAVPYEVTESVNFLWGDVNVDGAVNESDLLPLWFYIQDKEKNTLPKYGAIAANVFIDDLNNKGFEVNVDDYNSLAAYINNPSLSAVVVRNSSGVRAVNIIFGDITRDGRLNVDDKVAYVDIGLGRSSYSTVQRIAADINLDNQPPSISDMIFFNNFLDGGSKFPTLPIYEYTIREKLKQGGVSYETQVCYGDLQCDIEFDSSNSCANGGNIVARLESSHASRFRDGLSSSGGYPIKICCTSQAGIDYVPRGDSGYWADTNGNPIIRANVGDTVLMVAPDKSPYVRKGTTKFKVVEFDSILNLFGGWISDSVGFFNAETSYLNPRDAIGYWPITLQDIETSKTSDYNNFRFKEDTDLHIESNDLEINLTSDNFPMEFEIVTPKCGENISLFNVGAIEIRVVAEDSDDVLIGTIKVTGFDPDGNPLPNTGGFVHKFGNGGTSSLLDGAYIYTRARNNPGSYSIEVEVKSLTGRERTRKAYANIMVVNESGSGDYVAACITSPKDASSIPITDEKILFNATASRALKVENGVVREVGIQEMKFEWTFSDINAITKTNTKRTTYGIFGALFNRTLTTGSGARGFSPGFNWADLKINFGGEYQYCEETEASGSYRQVWKDGRKEGSNMPILDYYNRGDVSLQSATNPLHWKFFTDYCEGSTLIEYSCNNDASLGSVQYTCPEGCVDGVCVCTSGNCASS